MNSSVKQIVHCQLKKHLRPKFEFQISDNASGEGNLLMNDSRRLIEMFSGRFVTLEGVHVTEQRVSIKKNCFFFCSKSHAISLNRVRTTRRRLITVEVLSLVL